MACFQHDKWHTPLRNQVNLLGYLRPKFGFRLDEMATELEMKPGNFSPGPSNEH